MNVTKPRTAEEFMAALAALLDAYNEPHDAEEGVEEVQRVQVDADEQESQEVRSARTGDDMRPWEDVTGVSSKGLNLPMSPALYAKMLWITNNVPKMSLQKIAKAGAEAEADRLIALHYKP